MRKHLFILIGFFVIGTSQMKAQSTPKFLVPDGFTVGLIKEANQTMWAAHFGLPLGYLIQEYRQGEISITKISDTEYLLVYEDCPAILIREND